MAAALFHAFPGPQMETHPGADVLREPLHPRPWKPFRNAKYRPSAGSWCTLHPGTLTREQRVQALKAKKVLAQWMEALEDQEIHDLSNGAEPA